MAMGGKMEGKERVRVRKERGELDCLLLRAEGSPSCPRVSASIAARTSIHPLSDPAGGKPAKRSGKAKYNKAGGGTGKSSGKDKKRARAAAGKK